jgi:hypothetical protein
VPDPEEFKEFIGDLRLDITSLNRGRFKAHENHEYSLIENAIPNIPEEMLHPDYVQMQRLGYFP